MKYVVTQLYTDTEGTVSRPTFVFDTEPEALARYYNVLAVAATSQYPVHACIMYTNEGFPLKHECFFHEPAPAPEPEPEPEVTEEPSNEPQPTEEP